MAATFDSSLPTLRDRARLALGDTGLLRDDAGDPVWLMQDETLDALLEQGYEPGVAEAADALVSQFAQLPTKIGEDEGLNQEWSERIRAWRDLAARMRLARPTGSTGSSIGGLVAGGRITDPLGIGDLR